MLLSYTIYKCLFSQKMICHNFSYRFFLKKVNLNVYFENLNYFYSYNDLIYIQFWYFRLWRTYSWRMLWKYCTKVQAYKTMSIASCLEAGKQTNKQSSGN